MQDGIEIFIRDDMYDFAYRIAQEAMAAAFSNSKNIEGLSLDKYITRELKNEEGSG